jgi:pyruvate dehydrogenase E2 component (dihydrolipoamide acetyltransferase)
MFDVIIVPGQSAILAVGKVTKLGLVIKDSNEARLEIRPVMKVS